MNISRDSSVKGEDDKKKKKKKRKDKKKTGAISEDEDEAKEPQNFVISRAVEMPEGATLSDGDDDRDNLDENDPHRALGDIIFDDYKIESVEVDSRSSQQIEVGGIFAPVDSSKSKKKKKKEEKPAKKSKKKKEKREKESVKVEPQERNGNDAMDIDFWLATDQSNGVVEPPVGAAAPVNDKMLEKEHKKKKKEKKHKKNKKEKKENGGIVEANEHYRHLVTSKDLKICYELRKVPLDPDKLAAAIQVGISFLPLCVPQLIQLQSYRRKRTLYFKGV